MLEKRIKLGKTEVRINISKKGNSNLIFINLHEDEQTSVKAAKKLLETYDGTLIEIKSQGSRLIKFEMDDEIYSFDPNRMFSFEGCKQSLKLHSNYSKKACGVVTEFAQELLEYIKDKTIIALHNNQDPEFSIKSFTKGEVYSGDGIKVNVNKNLDLHDFFYVTQEEMYDSLSKKGFNVVLQDNANVTEDGSLSVYCAKNNIPYINVEAHFDHYEEQLKMLEELFSDYGRN